MATLLNAQGLTDRRTPHTLEEFHDVHRHDAIVVCGCGESLRLLEHPKDVITIGVNDVGRQFDPNYLVVLNPRRQFSGDRFQYVERSRAQHLFTQLDLGVPHPSIVRVQLGAYGGTTFGNPRVLHYTRNSPYVALCLAVHMGARQIGLIGVDFTDHHFFAATGRHPLSHRFAAIDAEYRRLREALDAMHVRVVNLSSMSRLTAFDKGSLDDLQPRTGRRRREPSQLVHSAPAVESRVPARHLVSYATTPVAGVPAILSRCISATSAHNSRCVWATRSYGNGVTFDGDLEWAAQPDEAERVLRSADAVIVHNGKVDSRHERLLSGKAIVTLAHNYMWNVDRRFERLGMPSLVVGQYQATLPEFAGWTAVPNPLPIWEPAYMHGEKPDVVTICYTPSGRHERYPQGHRLYWHGKGYETTMRVLERMSKVMPLRLEVIGERQLSHADALAMKRRAHIVIDECVTGSYHRNSLEGLATGCVVVNGVGILPGVAEVLRGCAPGMDRTPFVFSTLDTLEAVLTELVNRGPDVLAAAGHENRAWMEQHWNFADQWARWWEPAIEAAMAKASPIRRNPEPVRRVQIEQPKESISPVLHGISVVIPHGGSERLPLLASTLATLRQRSGIGEVIVVEMGRTPVAAGLADRWADSHLFIEHDGAFERARALNAGSAVARGDIIFWLDNDLLVPSTLLAEAVKELQHRRLDYLTPYSSVRYLSEQDSAAVMRGERDPQDCQPVNTFRTGRRGVLSFGGMGLVRREFLQRWGGLIEGFRGWGGEDNAWNRKVSLLGRGAATSRMDLHVHHLYHRSSGGYLMAAASSENPHYPENLALLRRVFAVRDRNEFARQFPAAAQAPAVVTSASRRTAGSHEDGPPVWTYWEGPCPAWIRACRRTITAHAPRVRILDPERFDRLWDRDRDVDLSRLHAPHRADFIRAFLVQRYGGLWIDADCLVMQPLEPLLDSLTEYDFIGHRERVGLISNAFIAARQGSRIAGAFYERVRQILKSRKSLYWNALGADPLSAIVASDATGWHELPCESVQPICWSRPGDFFVERDEAGHDREFNAQALCYMLSNGAINNYTASHHPPDLLSERTFFRYLLTRAIGKAGQDTSAAYESQFGAHVEIYRRQKIESLSGPGSCLAQTRELRERLPLLVESLGITSLVDAPCGDFNWMQHVALGPVDYTGVDVLGEIIADNQWRHASSRRRFIRANVVTDPLPRADAVLCRDLLVHLSYDDIKRTIRNFRSSGATYLLMTTFTKPRPNQDTSGGEWRPLNFLAPPFEFPPPVRLVNEKCTEAGDAFDDKSLGVWQLADLAI